jgi:hypothetical protein
LMNTALLRYETEANRLRDARTALRVNSAISEPRLISASFQQSRSA